MQHRWKKALSLLRSKADSSFFKFSKMRQVQKVRRDVYELFKESEDGSQRSSEITLLSEAKRSSMKIEKLETTMQRLSKSTDYKFSNLGSQIQAMNVQLAAISALLHKNFGDDADPESRGKAGTLQHQTAHPRESQNNSETRAPAGSMFAEAHTAPRKFTALRALPCRPEFVAPTSPTQKRCALALPHPLSQADGITKPPTASPAAETGLR
jgi:hypothetical protein